MTEERFEDLALEYLLGSLSAEDAASFEAELTRRGPEGAAVLRRVSETLGALALGAPPAEPATELRKRILSAIEGGARGGTSIEPVIPLHRARRWPWIAAAGIAAALALWLGVTNTRLRDERARVLSDRDRLAAELAAVRDTLSFVAAPQASVVSLAGTEAEPRAHARVFLDPATGRAILFAYELPMLAAGSVYELWAIAGDTPRPAGVFTVDPEGTGRLEIDDPSIFRDVDVFAVTVEPAPGTESPTGSMVLISGS
jgi:anti-sigma-K factor RskA